MKTIEDDFGFYSGNEDYIHLYDEILIALLDKKKFNLIVYENITDEPDESVLPMKIQTQIPILTDSNYIVGYWDIVARIGVKSLYIKIAPRIGNITRLLRTLRTYQNFEPDAHTIYVVSTDNSYKDVLESQGFKLVLYKTEGKK